MHVGLAAGLSPGPTERIVAEAAANDIPLPPRLTEERFKRLGSEAGPAAQFVGSWSTGAQRWSPRNGRRCMLIVLSVDPAQGVADTIVAYSAFTDDSRPGMKSVGEAVDPLYRRRVMRLLPNGTTLEWAFANGRTFRFNLASATDLNLVVTRNSAMSKVTMQRVD